MNNSVYLAKELELRIREVLEASPDNKAISVFNLYNQFSGRIEARDYRNWPVFGIVTSGFLNRVIADMKRSGIVGTTKGGEAVFLSEAAWAQHLDKVAREQKLRTEINVLVRNQIFHGTFKDDEDFKTKAVAANVAARTKDGITGDLDRIKNWLVGVSGSAR